jgi:phosphate transport system protein
LSALVLALLKGSLDAFVRRDSNAARAVIPRDKEVDSLHKEFQEQIIEYMKQNAENIGRCLHLLVATKSLERIADHAKNIAEEVVYLCEAQDIRHAPKS